MIIKVGRCSGVVSDHKIILSVMSVRGIIKHNDRDLLLADVCACVQTHKHNF